MRMHNGLVSVFVGYFLLPELLISYFPNSYNISSGNKHNPNLHFCGQDFLDIIKLTFLYFFLHKGSSY
jgi:hypothetical protein